MVNLRFYGYCEYKNQLGDDNMSALQLEVSKSLEGLSEENLSFLLEMINKYMKPKTLLNDDITVVSSDRRIGVLKDKRIFAPGYDFDEDNEEIAKLFGEI